MTHTHDEIMAMDADALRLAIAEAKGEVVMRLCDHDTESGAVSDLEGFLERNPTWYSADHVEKCKVDGTYFLWPCLVDKWQGHTFFLPVQDWPNDIGAALALVEEMRLAGQLVIIKLWPDRTATGQGVCDVEVIWRQLTDGYVQAKGIVPIALSRAYLLWKAEQP